MFLAIAVVASVLGVYRSFWDASRPNHQVLLGGFIGLTCVAIVAAIPAQSRLRGGFLGASLFGIGYLICVLKGGLGLETIYDSQALAKNTILGFALFGVSFLASQLGAMVAWPRAMTSVPRNAEHSQPREPAGSPGERGVP